MYAQGRPRRDRAAGASPAGPRRARPYRPGSGRRPQAIRPSGRSSTKSPRTVTWPTTSGSPAVPAAASARLQLAGRLDGGEGKHDGLGRLFAEPHVDDLAARVGLNVPAGQERRVDLRDLEALGNGKAEAIHRSMEDPESHRGMELLVGLGDLVKEHAARGDGLLAALQVAVQRHPMMQSPRPEYRVPRAGARSG